MEPPGYEQTEAFKAQYHENCLKKLDKLQALILADEHVSEMTTYLEWMSACLDMVSSCAGAGAMLDPESSFSQREEMMRRAELNCSEILRLGFVQVLKGMWAIYGEDVKDKK